MSPFPKCPICNHPHAKALAHIWDDTPAHGGTVDTPDLKSVAVKHEGSSPSGPTIHIPASSSGRTPDFESGNASSNLAAGASSEPATQQPFDRTGYQREYMRDLPKAKAEGLTVKQWREKHK